MTAKRRRFMQLTGGAGAAALAGCDGRGPGNGTGNGNGNGNGNGDGDGDGRVDATFTTAMDQLPTESHDNPYRATGYTEQWTTGLFDRLLYFNTQTEEYIPGAIADWSQDGATWEFTANTDLTWHDGEDVTAEDLARKLKLDIATESRLHEQASHEDVQVTGDATVEVEFDEELRGFLVLASLQGAIFLDTPASKFGEFEERLDDGEDPAAVDSDLGEYAPTDDILGNSPWRLVERDESRALHEVFDDHPAAADINWTNFEFLRIEANEQRWQALNGGEAHGYGPTFASMAVYETMAPYIERLLFPDYWGLGLVVNHEDPVLGNKEVRQAIAHVVDRAQVVENAGLDLKEPVGIPAGVVGYVTGTADQWFEGVEDQFETYGVDSSQTSRAESLMQDAGYSRNGDGMWLNDDGDVIDIPIKVPAGWSDWVVSVQTIATHLRDFGIEAQASQTPNDVYFAQLSSGDFRLMCEGWGGSQPHPYFTLNKAFGGYGQGTWTLPASYEAETLSGSVETVAPADDILADVPALGSDDEILDRIQQAAKVYNDALPVIPIQEKVTQNWLSRQGWEFPETSSEDIWVEYPVHYLNRAGLISADEDYWM